MKIDEILGAFNGKNRKRAARNTCAGLGLGVALGALAGLLFAPKSGKETREDICDAAEKGAEMVKDTAVKGAKIVKETAVTGAKKVSETARDVADKAKGMYADMKQMHAKTDKAEGEIAEDCEDEDVESAEF